MEFCQNKYFLILTLCLASTALVLCGDLPLTGPETIIFNNDTKGYTMYVSRYVCIGQPYQRTTLNYCKSQQRPNLPTILNVSLTIPELVNVLYLKVKLSYKFKSIQSDPIDMLVEACSFLNNPSKDVVSRHIFSVIAEVIPQFNHPCPFGNTTYNVLFWLEERHLPSSVPTGDYRYDAIFKAEDNVTLFSYQAFFGVRSKGVLRTLMNW
ncbi:uncharacterized protein LOC125948931 [Anopheles darlingi]|uniref:Putative secreted protein n=1 Tax=Anopheles darlingi TaxID=43151 RepID=A0A2M4DDN7_ANODA|nr:uncharacterized protein LOC125948931 [Anopheles darlingi]